MICSNSDFRIFSLNLNTITNWRNKNKKLACILNRPVYIITTLTETIILIESVFWSCTHYAWQTNNSEPIVPIHAILCDIIAFVLGHNHVWERAWSNHYYVQYGYVIASRFSAIRIRKYYCLTVKRYVGWCPTTVFATMYYNRWKFKMKQFARFLKYFYYFWFLLQKSSLSGQRLVP